jgi:hypothetical protein
MSAAWSTASARAADAIGPVAGAPAGAAEQLGPSPRSAPVLAQLREQVVGGGRPALRGVRLQRSHLGSGHTAGGAGRVEQLDLRVANGGRAAAYEPFEDLVHGRGVDRDAAW